MSKLFMLLMFVSLLGCQEKMVKSSDSNNQDAIINEYLVNGAWNHHYLSKEWDIWVTRGLESDSTVAYLWQQKALPFWKKKKYQIAISYYNKAVSLDRQKWLSRLAFLKCIFVKDYEASLVDLNAYKAEFGTTYEQDHSLDFYIGICYLQLNRYEEALKVFSENVRNQESEKGEDWVHFLDRYYLAITFYELGNYETAINEFDKVLIAYPNFSDAQYHKSLCLKHLGQKDKAKSLIAKGKLNFENGYTFNEDSSVYEDYPYQITWQWNSINSIIN